MTTTTANALYAQRRDAVLALLNAGFSVALVGVVASGKSITIAAVAEALDDPSQVFLNDRWGGGTAHLPQDDTLSVVGVFPHHARRIPPTFAVIPIAGQRID